MSLRLSWQGTDRKLNKAKLKDRLENLLQEFGLTGKFTLNIRLVDRNEMANLNFKYRGEKKATDILSFPLNLEEGPDGITRLGDLVICLPVASSQARKAKLSVNDQVQFLLEHGLRHLIGIHH